MTKLIVTFCNIANAHKNEYRVPVSTAVYWFLLIQNTWLHVSTRILVIFVPVHDKEIRIRITVVISVLCVT
jgi:hypothetical protein